MIATINFTQTWAGGYPKSSLPHHSDDPSVVGNNGMDETERPQRGAERIRSCVSSGV